MTDSPRRQKEKPNTDAWVTTYSDMVTLLLAFFVLLFTFASIDEAEFERAITSLQEAFGILRGGRTVTSAEPRIELEDIFDEMRHRDQIRDLEMSQLRQIRDQIGQRLEEEGMEDDVSMAISERGLVLQFTDHVLFDTAQAILLSEALDILDVLGPKLKQVPNQIRVEGHADSRPINTPQFPSNWELSTTRATSVLRYLLESHDLDPEQLSASGYGEYRPVATNETVEGRAMNRRVDVILLRLGASEYEPERDLSGLEIEGAQ